MRPKRERNMKTQIKRWTKQQRQLERRKGSPASVNYSGNAPVVVDAESVHRLVDQILSGDLVDGGVK
jgi:hypothetical protein